MDESEVLVRAPALDELLPEDPCVADDLAVDVGHEDVARWVAVDEIGVVSAEVIEGGDLLDTIRLVGRGVDPEHRGEVLLPAKLPNDEVRDGGNGVDHAGTSSSGRRQAVERSVTPKPTDS